MTEPVLHYDESLGQNTRSGSWERLAVGTYQVIHHTRPAPGGCTRTRRVPDEVYQRVGRRRNPGQDQEGTPP